MCTGSIKTLFWAFKEDQIYSQCVNKNIQLALITDVGVAETKCCKSFFLINGKVVLHVSVVCLDNVDSSWTI